MTERSCLAVILAAGEGTRMASSIPKVLHPVGGRAMLDGAIAAARGAGATRLAVVVGAGADKLRRHLNQSAPEAEIFEQTERLGTAHAVLAAEEALNQTADDVIILYGDTPLVDPGVIRQLRSRLADGVDLVVLGFTSDNPTGYGRLVMTGSTVARIVEEKDADASQRQIKLCNSGILGFRGSLLPELLKAIGNDNAKGEYYLTDAIGVAVQKNLKTALVVGPEEDFIGVNDRVQLSVVEGIFQRKARLAAMKAGATLVAPETVFFSHDTKLGRDVVVEPNVVFAPGVTVADGVTIRAFSHLEGAHVESGAIIGPYARLRPGAAIGPDAHIGNFVEIKAAEIAAGAKINHLSYIGDASVGARTNVGAGTITCNYDGVDKHITVIGSDVFVGSHSTLVAPVSLGNGSYTAAGSVITDAVPADAMAFGRARQSVKDGRGAVERARIEKRKAEKAGARKEKKP